MEDYISSGNTEEEKQKNQERNGLYSLKHSSSISQDETRNS